MTITEMLARNGRMYPERTAFIERVPSQNKRVQITWKQFDERVDRIANALIARGVKKGDIVMHWMMNSAAWLEAYFGIVRSGADRGTAQFPVF
jgi:acyl-CoA synthetase (AMP-forming)/AMP-acid ligase II